MELCISKTDTRTEFENLFSRYGEALYGYLRALLGREDLASDFTQEAFARLWEYLEKQDKENLNGSRENMGAYLFGIGRNAALNHLRKQRREAVAFKNCGLTLQKSKEGKQRSADKELWEAVLIEIEKLPVEQKETLLLKNAGNLTFQEIAELQHLPLKTVSSRYLYAVEKLKKNLSNFI